MAENRIRGVRWLSAGNNSGRRIPYDRRKQDQDSRAYCRRKPVQTMGGTSISPLDRGDSIRRRGHGECRADDVVLADRDAYSAYILKNRRAAYGEKIVSTLSRQLEPEFGRGFSAKALHHMVRFTEASGQQGLEFS